MRGRDLDGVSFCPDSLKIVKAFFWKAQTAVEAAEAGQRKVKDLILSVNTSWLESTDGCWEDFYFNFSLSSTSSRPPQSDKKPSVTVVKHTVSTLTEACYYSVVGLVSPQHQRQPKQTSGFIIQP